MTFPSKAAADSWKAGGVEDPYTAQLFLHQPVPSFCKPITQWGKNALTSKLREVLLKLQQDMP